LLTGKQWREYGEMDKRSLATSTGGPVFHLWDTSLKQKHDIGTVGLKTNHLAILCDLFGMVK